MQFDEKITSYKHKRSWILNNKLNDNCWICSNLNLIELFYSWRRKLAIVDFLDIIGSLFTLVDLSFWLVPSNHYAEIWIVGSPFKIVGLPFNSKEFTDQIRLAVCE